MSGSRSSEASQIESFAFPPAAAPFGWPSAPSPAAAPFGWPSAPSPASGSGAGAGGGFAPAASGGGRKIT
jgi:hypothetical protein